MKAITKLLVLLPLYQSQPKGQLHFKTALFILGKIPLLSMGRKQVPSTCSSKSGQYHSSSADLSDNVYVVDFFFTVVLIALKVKREMFKIYNLKMTTAAQLVFYDRPNMTLRVG
ncbi:MAG: hypothetical protein R2766_09530 [Saprospiraceae bacterium]